MNGKGFIATAILAAAMMPLNAPSHILINAASRLSTPPAAELVVPHTTANDGTMLASVPCMPSTAWLLPNTITSFEAARQYASQHPASKIALCRYTTRLTAMVPGSLVTTEASIAIANARVRRAEAAYDDALSQGAGEAGALIAARTAYQEATADTLPTPLTCTTHNNVYQFWYDNIVVNGVVRLVIEPQLWYNVSSGSSCNHNFYQPEQLIDITDSSPKVSFVYSVIVGGTALPQPCASVAGSCPSNSATAIPTNTSLQESLHPSSYNGNGYSLSLSTQYCLAILPGSKTYPCPSADTYYNASGDGLAY